jgi:hypothetical protein
MSLIRAARLCSSEKLVFFVVRIIYATHECSVLYVVIINVKAGGTYSNLCALQSDVQPAVCFVRNKIGINSQHSVQQNALYCSQIFNITV